MKIICGNCSFTIYTSGEGFSYSQESLNFCLKCGRAYTDTGVNISKLFKANKEQINCQTKIVSWFGFVPAVSFLLIVLLILFNNPGLITKDNVYISLLLIFGLPIVYIPCVLMVAFRKGFRKYNEVLNETD